MNYLDKDIVDFALKHAMEKKVMVTEKKQMKSKVIWVIFLLKNSKARRMELFFTKQVLAKMTCPNTPKKCPMMKTDGSL